MSIDTGTFAPRDAKIIKENEAKTPYELLELGLSEKAYQRMISGDYKEKKEEPSKETPKQETAQVVQEEKSNIVKPKSVQEVPTSKTKLTAPNVYKAQKVASNVGSVNVYNKRTGSTVKMSVSAANRLAKQPNIYQILR